MKSLHSPQYAEILKKLILRRKQLGYTQKEVAKNLGKRQSFISKTERLERRLDVLEFLTLCDLYKKKASFFL